MPTQKKTTSQPDSGPQIPDELNNIINQRAKCLDKYIENHKREYENCLKLEKELTEGVNENKKAKRLHNKELKEYEEEIEKQLETERNKLKKEKRVFERQNKAMKNLPNRKEREQIDALAKQLKDLEESMRMKEQRNRLTTERLKKQVIEAKEKYEELAEERDNIYLAVKGTKYDGDRVAFEDTNDQSNEPPVDDANTHVNPQHINFYHPMDNEEEKNKVDLDDMSHSPQFGTRKPSEFTGKGMFL